MASQGLYVVVDGASLRYGNESGKGFEPLCDALQGRLPRLSATRTWDTFWHKGNPDTRPTFFPPTRVLVKSIT